MKGSLLKVLACMGVLTLSLAFTGQAWAQEEEVSSALTICEEGCRAEFRRLRRACLDQKAAAHEACRFVPSHEQRECELRTYFQYIDCERAVKGDYVACLASCRFAFPLTLAEE